MEIKEGGRENRDWGGRKRKKERKEGGRER